MVQSLSQETESGERWNNPLGFWNLSEKNVIPITLTLPDVFAEQIGYVNFVSLYVIKRDKILKKWDKKSMYGNCQPGILCDRAFI